MASILVLEDDSHLAELISKHLGEKHQVSACANGLAGLKLALQSDFNLLIIDLGLPGMDGLEVCKEFRKHNEQTPILILTSRNSEIDRVIGLELGADDYMGKPFSIHELQARVKAILRRQQLYKQEEGNDKGLRFEELSIDPLRHEVICRGNRVELTAREFDLLYFLASHPGRVYSREQLLNEIWGYTSDVFEHTVNSNINRLRSKLEQDAENPHFVITVRGVGYKFSDPGH